MLLLALDTSTSAITVALHDGDRVLAQATTLDARAHGERLAPGIQQVLTQTGATPTELTTGLRVGIVTARVLAFTTGAALHGVCSLDALAADGPTGEVLVATDARRKEVYWARYAVSPGSVRALTLAAVDRPADLPEQVRALPTLGRGPLLYPELFPAPVGILDVSAAALAGLAVRRLAAGAPLSDHEPLYLRRPDAAPHIVTKSALG